jgi:hypothetical protein
MRRNSAGNFISIPGKTENIQIKMMGPGLAFRFI